jgi:hypothetical protein
MKVLVFGGRNYRDEKSAFAALDVAHSHQPITLIIAGGASGADTLAERWADARGVPKVIMPARWQDLDAPGAVIKVNSYGKQYNVNAGFDRNQAMLDLDPDGGIKFPGVSGTRDMLDRLTRAGKQVWSPYG